MSLATTFRKVLQPRAFSRALSVSLMAAFLLPVTGAPASAANFLEKLFGMQQQPVAAPRPSVVLPPVAPPSTANAIRRQKPKSEIVKARPSGATPVKAIAVRPPALPGPLGPFLLDPTLRRGDVVVTSEGLKVFAGQGRSQHGTGDFIALSQANRFVAGNTSALTDIDRANRLSSRPLVEVQAVPAAKPAAADKSAPLQAEAAHVVAADKRVSLGTDRRVR